MGIWSSIYGISLGLITYIGGIILDFTIDNVTRLKMIEEEPELYNELYKSTFVNLLVISPLYFMISELYMVNNGMYYIGEVVIIVLMHNLFYYMAHYTMHNNNSMKNIHIYHHFYKRNIIPSVANAVSVNEMLYAYLTPFQITALLIKPELYSFIIGVSIISFMNLIIHSTHLCNYKWVKGLVSPMQHNRHHNLYTEHYSAPVFDIG